MADGGEDTREPDTSPGLGDLLDVFLAQLQEDGLTIGARERVAAHAVTARWLQDRQGAASELAADVDSTRLLRELGPLLAPILARSREERERFFAILGRLSPEAALQRGDGSAEHKRSEEKGPAWRLTLQVWICLLGAVLLAGLIWAGAVRPWKPADQPAAAEPVALDRVAGGGSRIERMAPDIVEEDAPILQTADRWLARVLAAAEQHDFAPTLEEVAASVMLDPEHGRANFVERTSAPTVINAVSVLSAGFSPDGASIVTASEDNTARVWRAGTDGAWTPTVLKGHGSYVTSAAFSPDGASIVTASGDNTARVWRAGADGAWTSTVLKGHWEEVTSAAFSPDGASIVTASWDSTARVWRAGADGAWTSTVLNGPENEVRSATFSPDGASIVITSQENNARVWRAREDGTWTSAVLEGHGGWVNTAGFSPDGASIVTASYDGTARVWRVGADGAWSSTVLEGHGGPVFSATFSPDGESIITASEDMTTRVWRAGADGAWTSTILDGHVGPVRSAAFSPDGASIVTASDDGTARVWRAGADGTWTSTVLKGHRREVTSAAFSPDGASIVTDSNDLTARVWRAGADGAWTSALFTTAWTSQRMAARLNELSGLPVGVPLDLFRPGSEETSGWARLALALARIEAPAEAPPIAELDTAASRAFETASVDGAPALIAPLTAIAAEEAPPADIGLLVDRLNAEPAIDGASAGAVNRALAILGDERLPAPEQVWKSPPPHPASSVAPAWLRWLAAAVPLGFLFWFFTKYALRRPFLRRRQPRVPPLHTDLVSDAGRRVAFDAGLFQRAGQRLLSRTPQASSALDIRETLSATLREGGVFITPVYASTRARPEYLILIERASASDHEALRLRQLIERLKGLVDYDIWYFQTEPGELESDDRARRITIEQAQTRFPEHRLIILGTGEGFLDPVSFEPRPVAQKLRFWPRRALLTPVALADWSREEYALAEGLSMPIGRATPEGLLTLSDLLGLDGVDSAARLNPKGDGLARPLPDIFRGGGQRFLYPSVPDELTLRRLIRELRGGLDAQGFEWLAAIGVYPAIQWDLTLYLGVELARLPGGDPVRDPLYDEARLATLSQLPWLKAGQMPNWLRRALIAELSPVRREEVRQVIARAIEAARPQDRAEEEKLRLRIGREAPKEALPPERLFDDEVLLDFLMGRNEEDFPLARLTRLNQIFQRSFWEQFGAPEWLTALAALASAATVFAVTPHPGLGPMVTGALLPLVILAVSGLVATIFWHPGASIVRLFWIAERASPLALVAITTSMVFMVAAWFSETSGYSRLMSFGSIGALVPYALLWATCFIGGPFGLLLFRWAGERLGFNIFAVPLAQPGGWQQLLLRSAGLAVTFVLGGYLFGDLIGSLLRGLTIVHAFGLLFLPFLILSVVGWISSRFGLASANKHARSSKDVRASLLPQLGRLSLVTASISTALLVAMHLKTAHIQKELNFAPTEVVSSVDGGLILSISASGDLAVFTADGNPIGAPVRTGSGRPAAVAIGGTPQAPRIAFADASGRVFMREPGSSLQPLIDPETGGQFVSVASPPKLGFGPDGRLFAAVEKDGATRLLVGGRTVSLGAEFGPPAALIALEPGLAAVATLDGSVHFVNARAVQTGPTIRTASQPLDPPSAARQLLSGNAPGTFRMLSTDGRLWTVRYGADEELQMEDAGVLAALALGPPVRSDKSRSKPRDWPNFTEADLQFSFLPAGELIDGSGTGLADTTNWAPEIAFPIADHPAWLNSHIYSPGGGMSGGDQCDARNFAYPWRDTFCESRSSSRANTACPDPRSTSIVRIRAGTPALCRDISRAAAADRQQVSVVAADDGVISSVDVYTVVLDAGTHEYRYIHLNMAALAISEGQSVRKGDLLGYLSNDFGGTPTTLGIGFEVRLKREGEPPLSVSPYMALVEAYDRKLAGIARDKGLAYESAVGQLESRMDEQALPVEAGSFRIAIASEDQRAQAEEMQRDFSRRGMTVLGIELRAAESPAIPEVRYFDAADQETASSIAATAKRRIGITQVVRARAPLGESPPPELWFARKTGDADEQSPGDVVRDRIELATETPAAEINQGARFALVVSQSNYSKLSDFRLSESDADQIQQALSSVGFNVMRVNDVTGFELRESFDDFFYTVGRAGPGSISFVYYTGHAVQSSRTGASYLLGTDANVETEMDLLSEGLSVDDLKIQLSVVDSEAAFMVFDVSTSDEGSDTSSAFRLGLARQIPEANALVALSSSPGTYAEEGRYAPALAGEIVKVGVTAEQVFNNVGIRVARETERRQIPWISSSLSSRVCFAGCDE
ncbi:caspase family protein [Hyphomonas sp.]|uniref:caspase family protein n=1 Tax=Hyphomonas sp. TaxID=87 RepID=UPI0025BF3C40|nr:caspase family protein [Hyphomonas sp.]